jgi:importin subunit alpha-6/7
MTAPLPLSQDACWAISNITAGPIRHIQAVIDEGLIAKAVESFNNSETTTKIEICWMLKNAANGGAKDSKIIETIVEQGVLRVFCDLLEAGGHKERRMALEGMEHIIQSGDIQESEDGTRTNKYDGLMEDLGLKVRITSPVSTKL